MGKINSLLAKLFKKYRSIPVAARAALWFVACSMLQKCLGFITVPIFTRLMPTEEYGLYSTYLSWYSILTVVCTLNMHNCIYVNQYTKAKNEQEKNAVAIPLLSLGSVLTLIVFAIYIIFRNQLSGIIGMPFPLVCLLFAQILFEPPVNFWSMKQRFEYKYVLLVVVTLAIVVLNAGLGILFVYLSQTNQAIARGMSVVLVQVIFGGTLWILFFGKGKKIFSTKGWLHALKVQLPLLPHGLSLTILNSSDRIMIKSLKTATDAAIYSVAYSAGYVVSVLKTSIVDAMRPWMYQKIKDKEYSDISKSVNTIMVVITLISVGFTAFAPEIIIMLAPEEYYEAVYVIPPVAASSFFTFLYSMFSIVSMYHEKTTKIMIASVSGALLNIILNYVCIQIFGYIAAAYTTMFCFMFFTFAHYLIMRSVCKEYLDNVKLFDTKAILIMSVIVLAVTIIFELIYEMWYIRYFIILTVAVIIFINRKKFMGTIKQFKKKKKS